jgi:hypothetical protein
MDNQEATAWLSQFIGKNLRIHTTDNRIFGGTMRCTDKVLQPQTPPSKLLHSKPSIPQNFKL